MRKKKVPTLKGVITTPYDLPNPEEEKKMIERTKPSVERRKTKAEEKYNDFVKQLYKKKKIIKCYTK